MKRKDLLITKEGKNVRIALIEDEKLIEVHNEKTDSNISVGDVFLGKVRKIMPSLNASFVDIGSSKDAFLHYNDLGGTFKTLDKYLRSINNEKQKSSSLNNLKFENELEREGLISETVSSTQEILVQVTKEPISTKGPRLSSEISIAGRYVILIPFSNKISVSQKINNKSEKDKLKKYVRESLPKGFGAIIRTIAEKKKKDDIVKDIKELENRWKVLYNNIKSKKAPCRVLGESSRVISILRDIFDGKFKSIEIDNEEIYNEVNDYINTIAPEKNKIVNLYEDKNLPLFEKYSVEKQLKSSFGKVVHMLKGAYLVIEHTEAMHVIDINSGNKATNSNDQEENAMTVNLLAAKEIARQLRLRDMGGIIVIDFIDLKNRENRNLLYEKFTEFMSDDKAKHKILPLSKFGLIQMTRQRVRPFLNINIKEKNPSKNNDEIEAPITLISKIESDINKSILNYKGEINVHLHPFIASYVTKGVFSSIKKKWKKIYHRKINIVERDAYKYLEYNILDDKGKFLNEIYEELY